MVKSNQPLLPKLLKQKHKKALLRRNLKEKQRRRPNQLLLNILKPLQQNMKRSMTPSQQEVALLTSILVMLKRAAIRRLNPSRPLPRLALLEIDISSLSLPSSTTTIRTPQ